MNVWYMDALDKLLEKLKLEGRVNGLDFLEDFFLENREMYFEDLEYDDVEQSVSSEFEAFQNWLKEQDGIKILPNGKWIQRPQNDNAIQGEVLRELEVDVITLTEEEGRLLELQIYEMSSTHFASFKALYSWLAATNLNEKKYKCAFRLAKCGEINRDVHDNELINLWVSASGAASDAGFSKKTCESLSEAAYHCLRISKHKDAAGYFQNASKILDVTDFELKSQLLKNSRIQYQMVGDHESAADVFSEEKKLEYSAASLPLKFVLSLYRVTSNYGESPGRVAVNVVIVLIVATFLSYLSGIKCGEPFLERVVDCLYYSVVTFTTLGYGDITPVTIPGKLLSGFLATLGLLYTSLFMVTVVRKYARA